MKTLILTGKPQEVLNSLAEIIKIYGLDTTLTAVNQLVCHKMATASPIKDDMESLLDVSRHLSAAAYAVAGRGY